MGVFDRLINGLHFNNSQNEDEYDMDNEQFDDEEDLDEEQPRRRGLFSGRRAERNDPEPEDEPRYEDDRPQRQPIIRQQPQRSSAPMVPSRRNSSAAGMQVRIIRPGTFDQASEIADTLLVKRTVLLNLEGLDVNTAQRIVDFASGACYALHGNFMRISNFIIVITPEEVDIAGDVDSNANLMGMFQGMAAGSSAGGSTGSAYNAGNGSNYGTAAGGNTYNFGSYAQPQPNNYQNNYNSQYSNV